MLPSSASLIPTIRSSNLGQRMPGVSRSCRVLSTVIHCLPLVTPGLLPVFAADFFANELMNVDLPTFGIPAIMARRGLFTIPLFLSRSIFSLQASAIMGRICRIPEPALESISQAKRPFCRKCATQALFSAGSARSLLFRRRIRDFPAARLSISGFLPDRGALASVSSITRSTRRISSCICLFARVICPGYH